VWPSECVETVNQLAKQSVESFEKLCCSHLWDWSYNHAADPRIEVVTCKSGDGLTTTQLQTIVQNSQVVQPLSDAGPTCCFSAEQAAKSHLFFNKRM
jgi:hypothetical protein